MYVYNAQSLKCTNLYGKNLTTHVLDAYVVIAERWRWANYMHQTNQGPRFPAHRFILPVVPDTQGAGVLLRRKWWWSLTWRPQSQR